MNNNQEFFISLLSSHLNNEIPKPMDDISWSEIFKLAELQNLTAVISLEIKKLPTEYQPNAKGKSFFNQALGLTIQNAQIKEQAIADMKNALSGAEIVHTIIKGGAIRHLYPTPEVRTSGDTDVVISEDDKEEVKETLLNADFQLTSESVNQLVFNHLGQEFQFKTYFDCLSKDDQMYFSLDLREKQDGTTYFLNPNCHLLYVINHLLKHIKSGGVGFRQLMDVDIILRKQEINLEQLFWTCRNMGIEKSAKVVIALSNRLFNTPVDINYDVDEELFEHLIDIMLTGGVFGYGISNAGTVRLANKGSKFKALISMLFATKEYMYNTYLYANKHHWLLPIAYLHRWFDAVFKRGKRNTKNLKSIFNDNENATKLADIQKELEI